MPKLLSFVPKNGLPFPGMRPSQLSTFEVGAGKYADWNVHVRGPQVLLESPPGWDYGRPIDKTNTARKIYELPRAEVFLCWKMETGDDLRDLVNWSPPLKPEPELATGEPEPDEPAPIVEVVTRPSDAPPTSSPQPDVEEGDPDDDDDLPRTPAGKRSQRR